MRIPTHAMALAGLEIVTATKKRGFRDERGNPVSFDHAMARAAGMVADDDTAGAARLVADALSATPPGNAGWTIPIDPLLGVQGDDRWADVLAVLRDRAR